MRVTPVKIASKAQECTRKNGIEVFQFTRSSGARSMAWACKVSHFVVRRPDSLPTSR